MSLQVGKIKGIPIRVHFTLLISFLLITWTTAIVFTQHHYHGFTIVAYWIVGAIIAAILFLSVLLHELAHSIVALKYGLRIRQIVLFIFGGVSDISDEPKDYRKEAKMALVGPAMSFTLAGIFTLFWWLIAQASHTESAIFTLKQATLDILYYAALINVILGAFNLIPAFPSDGGRILRAALVRLRKDYDKGTKDAVNVGIIISYGFMAFGFVMMVTGSFLSGVWTLLIGWFLNSGARSYIAQQELSSVLSHVRLRDIMNTNIISVGLNLTVNEMLTGYFQTYMKSAFPVVNNQNQLLGVVTLNRTMEIPDYKRQNMTAEDVMIPLVDLIVMRDDAKANEALLQMTRGGGVGSGGTEEQQKRKKQIGKIFVCDDRGMLIGLVSKTDIMNIESERQEYVQQVKKFGTT
ncbi:MAG TPA: site-2 protease family protein [Candidatus Nitrosopolaris sp.]|nr:site-2 protease family protein [Candidatus Nitrosopolaris sp.]